MFLFPHRFVQNFFNQKQLLHTKAHKPHFNRISSRLWVYLEEGKMEAIAKGAKDEKDRATVIKRIADFIKKEGRGLGHRR